VQLSEREALSILSHIHRSFWFSRSAILFQRRQPFSPTFAMGPERPSTVPLRHAAQAVDLEIARPVLLHVRLSPDAAGYRELFGEAYLGSPLGRGALEAAARKYPAVKLRCRQIEAIAESLQRDIDYAVD